MGRIVVYFDTMMRPLVVTLIFGTLISAYGTANKSPMVPTLEVSTGSDDVDTNTAVVTEVIDDVNRITSTGQTYPELIDNGKDEVKYPTHFPDDVANFDTIKSTTESNIHATTSNKKQILKPMKISPTSLADVENFVTEQTKNSTNVLQSLRTLRTEKYQQQKVNQNNSSLNSSKQNVTLHNVTTEYLRIPNSSLSSITTFQVDSSTELINASKSRVDPSATRSSFSKDTTSPESLSTTLDLEPTTALDDSKEHTSPRPSIRVQDSIEASRIDMSINRALQRRRNINHAALWITIGFVVVLVSYIGVLVFYNRRRSDWQPSSQEYQRFEDDGPEVSTATTGCSTTEDDNISNHSTDAMTQTHPFLDTIGETDREITGYYSDSEQLYRQ